MRFNYLTIIKVMGIITLIEGIGMLPCALTALYFNEGPSASALAVTGIICIIAGAAVNIGLKNKDFKLNMRDGFLIAGIGWFYCSVIGMIPFFFSGCDFPLIGCYFESVAGFTTTNSTVLDHNLMPHALQLWRAICHWLGGLGILILVTSVFPFLSSGRSSVVSAESPGLFQEQSGNISSDFGKVVYAVYTSFTAAEFLLLLAGPLDWFNALTATLSSISTAGLIVNDSNMALFELPYVRGVILCFTVLSSISYLFYYMILHRRWKEVRANMEVRVFLLIICVSTLIIACSLAVSGTYSSLWQAVKDSLCQVVSFASTSGYFVCDYTKWPSVTQTILILLMLTGGCAMSTSGSLKVFRVNVLAKIVQRGIFKRIHPNAIRPITMGGRRMQPNVVSSVSTHILLYFAVLLIASVLLSLNNLDMETTITTAITMFSNTGVALGEAGASGYFGMFNGFSQFIMTVLMITGKLEMYSVILLFTSSFWRPDKVSII